MESTFVMCIGTHTLKLKIRIKIYDTIYLLPATCQTLPCFHMKKQGLIEVKQTEQGDTALLMLSLQPPTSDSKNDCSNAL